MWPPAKVDGVWPFNDAWLRTSLEEARRQTPRNVASILDSARELGIRDAQGGGFGCGGGFARRGPAVGLMAGGARPETDAHRGIIGRSWPSKSPLRAL